MEDEAQEKQQTNIPAQTTPKDQKSSGLINQDVINIINSLV